MKTTAAIAILAAAGIGTWFGTGAYGGDGRGHVPAIPQTGGDGVEATPLDSGSDGAGGGTEGTTDVAPAMKPLAPCVVNGIEWLVKTQHESGGFGQGEESAQMGASMQHLREKPNVADTCIAALAILRAGSTPADGPHAAAVRKAVAFVCREVEAAPEEGLAVTSVQGTRVQMKIGTHVDTFLASELLATVRGKMGDEAAGRRVVAALDKVMDKIEKNQRKDGGFDQAGWAPVLSMSLAARGLNAAKNAGAEVSEMTLERIEGNSKSKFAPAPAGGAEPAAAAADAAGIPLYANAANLGVLQQASTSWDDREKELKSRVATASKPAEREEAARQIEAIAEGKKVYADAQSAIVGRISDPAFVSGFGSNGGEEFLSYLNISESLVQDGGGAWTKWDGAMSENLSRIQNQDGSWSGHHCITGRTFCTAAALMVLMADRAPGAHLNLSARR